MEFTTLAMFVLTFASVLALPGPNSAYVVGQTLKYGTWNSIFVPLGLMTATGIHAVLVFSGVGVLLAEYSLALSVLKWLGVGYLIYLAYKAFTQSNAKLELSFKSINRVKMFYTAMFVSLTNPKALLASLLIYPLFVSQSGSYTEQAAILTVAAMIVSFAVYGGYCGVAASFKNGISKSRMANNIVGSTYLGAASILAAK
jgi:homoserine/homoserine lactone efflux protein